MKHEFILVAILPCNPLDFIVGILGQLLHFTIQFTSRFENIFLETLLILIDLLFDVIEKWPAITSISDADRSFSDIPGQIQIILFALFQRIFRECFQFGWRTVEEIKEYSAQ